MSAATPQCDFDNPASVVTAFIQAMNAWEVESSQSEMACRTTNEPFSYQSSVRNKMDAIFVRFCTPKERKFVRLGSFAKPPEYNPAKERVLETQIDESRKRAYVTTLRESVLFGGRHRYALARKEGKWLIDALKCERRGKWQNAIL